MMRAPRLFALLAGLALFPVSSHAQDYKLEEAASFASLATADPKPKTIVFADQPNEGQDGVFIPYEEWAKNSPVQQQFLGLYPGYTEPNTDIIIDGVKKRYREKLHMYVAEAKFVLAKAPSSIELAKLATLPFAQQLDPAIKHQLITPADLARPKEPKTVYNQNPQRRWCEGRPVAICLHSTYKLEGRLPAGIALANKIREGNRRISDTLEFDGELTVLSPQEVADRGLAKLTRLDTAAVGAVEQSIFYVNQVMQYGKLIAVFQQHPTDPNKTVTTVFMSLAVESNILGKRREYAQVPILRNLVPAQVLSGKSTFNSGSSLSAGLPVYARNQVKAIAAILDRG
jgi:hypothetical protein